MTYQQTISNLQSQHKLYQKSMLQLEGNVMYSLILISAILAKIMGNYALEKSSSEYTVLFSDSFPKILCRFAKGFSCFSF